MFRVVLAASFLLLGLPVLAQSSVNCGARVDAIKVFECGRGLTSPYVVAAKVVRISDEKIIANLKVAEFSDLHACQDAVIQANKQ